MVRRNVLRYTPEYLRTMRFGKSVSMKGTGFKNYISAAYKLNLQTHLSFITFLHCLFQEPFKTLRKLYSSKVTDL